MYSRVLLKSNLRSMSLEATWLLLAISLFPVVVVVVVVITLSLS